jgi:hypothetical protein
MYRRAWRELGRMFSKPLITDWVISINPISFGHRVVRGLENQPSHQAWRPGLPSVANWARALPSSEETHWSHGVNKDIRHFFETRVTDSLAFGMRRLRPGTIASSFVDHMDTASALYMVQHEL